MGLSRVLLLSLSHLLISSQTLAQQGNWPYSNCSNSLGNYTTNSPYQQNLNTLLSSLASDNQVDYGFYTLSVGQSPNQVNSIALCRGDVSLNDCRGCIINFTRKIIQDCPNQKEAIGFFDFCVALYSNRSLAGIIGGFVPYHSSNDNFSDTSTFNTTLRDLLFRIRDVAASGNSLRKFATGNQTAGFYPIYGLVQCTPNLSQQQCGDCLDRIIPQVQDCCSGKVGGRVITPSCNLRFERYRFYGETFTPPQSPAPAGMESNATLTIIIAVIIVVCICICICICIIRRRRLKKNVQRGHESYSSELFQIDDAESLQFNLDIIRTATNHFSADNKLGQGGFGAVYKGTLSDGKDIAVKRLSRGRGQGDLLFKNELVLLAKLRHRNLVRLLGFCLERNERLLVYEFVSNSSLDHFVFDPVKRANLGWAIRYKIIGGIAKGLLYLHEDSPARIIHRDVKPSNVLLDEEMNPKISDFGLAKLFSIDKSQDETSRIAGTYGYMAPEYVMHGQFSVKSDVYSYGVLVLEMLTGQRNSCFRIGENEENLLSSAWKTWGEGTFLTIIDPTIRTDGSMTEMMNCVHIALLCVQENVATRPTMASVFKMLSSQPPIALMPTKPAFFNPSKTETARLSKNDASITQLYPR